MLFPTFEFALFFSIVFVGQLAAASRAAGVALVPPRRQLRVLRLRGTGTTPLLLAVSTVVNQVFAVAIHERRRRTASAG